MDFDTLSGPMLAVVIVYSTVAVLRATFAVLTALHRMPARPNWVQVADHLLMAVICVSAGMAASNKPIVSDVIWIARVAWGVVMLLSIWTLITYVRLSLQLEHDSPIEREDDERPL